MRIGRREGERELTRYAALSDSDLVEYLSLGGSKAFADKGLILVGAMRKIRPSRGEERNSAPRTIGLAGPKIGPGRW